MQNRATGLGIALVTMSMFFGATLVSAESGSASFTDVAPDTWFAPYVFAAAEAGIVSGYKDQSGQSLHLFKPAASVTLAEALKMGVEAAGYDFNLYKDYGIFPDHWVSPYYRVALGEGFGTFVGAFENVDEFALRSEVAKMITDAFFPDVQFEGKAEPTKNVFFADVSSNTAWRESILFLAKEGIISGDVDPNGNTTGNFRPIDRINRAEVAKLVMKVREKYGTPGKGRHKEGN